MVALDNIKGGFKVPKEYLGNTLELKSSSLGDSLLDGIYGALQCLLNPWKGRS